MVWFVASAMVQHLRGVVTGGIESVDLVPLGRDCDRCWEPGLHVTADKTMNKQGLLTRSVRR